SPAEGEGFEPPGPLQLCLFSRQVPYQLGKPSVFTEPDESPSLLISLRSPFSVAGRARTFLLRLRRPALDPIELPQLIASPIPRAGLEPAPVTGGASETPASAAFR